MALPYARRQPTTGAQVMSKGMDRKKETKKKPAKTREEKKAAKKAKK
jgi:hypothetical protein